MTDEELLIAAKETMEDSDFYERLVFCDGPMAKPEDDEAIENESDEDEDEE